MGSGVWLVYRKSGSCLVTTDPLGVVFAANKAAAKSAALPMVQQYHDEHQATLGRRTETLYPKNVIVVELDAKQIRGHPI